MKRTTSLFRTTLIAATFLFSLLQNGKAQGPVQADAYFLSFRFDGLRRPLFCLPVDSATSVATSFGVLYDDQGRPETVYRFYFGNIESRADWSIMKFRYTPLGNGSLLVHRSWHNPGGLPLQIGIAYGEDDLYDSTGHLQMVTWVDNEGNRVERVNNVTRMLYRSLPSGEIMQEWRFANNKQYYGIEQDIWDTQLSPLDKEAWFRRYRLDSNGFAISEYPLGFDLKPVRFPGGEEVRVYRRDECGQPLEVSFFDQNGKPMSDSLGVHSLRFRYDSSGRLVEWSSRNISGNLYATEQFGGAARGERVFREFDGKLIEEHLYDADGREIN